MKVSWRVARTSEGGSEFPLVVGCLGVPGGDAYRESTIVTGPELLEFSCGLSPLAESSDPNTSQIFRGFWRANGKW